MAAYVIFDVNVQDAAGYEEYRQAGSPSVPQHGGKYIVRGGRAEVLEGNWRPGRVIVIEFESFDQAKRWYNSPEYQKILPGRLDNSTARAFVVEGVS